MNTSPTGRVEAVQRKALSIYLYLPTERGHDAVC